MGEIKHGHTNYFREAIKDYSDITSDFKTLIDLEKDFIDENILLINRTNGEIVLKFYNGDDSTLTTLFSHSFEAQDNFPHNGLIEFKYTIEPTTGSFKIKSW